MRARQLIVAARDKYHCEYDGYLTNHLLHFMVALEALGASEVNIRTAYDHYVQRLEPAQPARPVGDWRDWEGENDNFLGLVHYFQAMPQLDAAHLEPVFDCVAKDVWGAAFHGIIHLGWAVRGRDDALLPEGLAYLVGYSRRKGAEHAAAPPPPTGAPATIDELLATAAAVPNVPFVKGDHSFDEGLRAIETELGRRDGFVDVDLSGLLTLEELATAVDTQLMPSALNLHEQTGARDFFVLHGVTSLYALLQLLRSELVTSVELGRRLVQHWWRGVLLTYVRQGRPELSPLQQGDNGGGEKELGQYLQRILTEDEHLTKLALVCKEHNRLGLFYTTADIYFANDCKWQF